MSLVRDLNKSLLNSMKPILITSIPHLHTHDEEVISVPADRHMLQKKIWRSTAADGQEFALDLEEPISHGTVLQITDGKAYVITQAPEPVLEVMIPVDAADAAQLGWMIGNQHLPVEVRDNALYVEAVNTVAEFFKRQHIHFHAKDEVFQPSPHSRNAGHHHH